MAQHPVETDYKDLVDIIVRREAELELQGLNEDLGQRVDTRTAALQKAKIAVDRANQAKRDCLANISHGLRTSLTADAIEQILCDHWIAQPADQLTVEA